MKINGLSVGYPDKLIMKDIRFQIEEGKVYALLGRNGAGKTTLLKTICGLLKKVEGAILINETELLSLSEKERAKYISYVPQRSDIVYNTSVKDIVLMGVTPYLTAFQLPNREHNKQAEVCLEKVGMESFSAFNYLSLSEGQKQLVLIARALMQNSRYLLFDEPDSSLDLVNKHRLMMKIREIIRVNKKCALISMHDPEYALNYCDKLLLIKDGKITEADVKADGLEQIENKLIEIYGPVKLLKYENHFMFYYNG